MASFGSDGKSPVMIAEDMKYDDGVVMEAVVEKFVKYFKSIIHHNAWYFGYFVFCKWASVHLLIYILIYIIHYLLLKNILGETLNFVSLVFQFYLVDVFLNNKFRWFGWEVDY